MNKHKVFKISMLFFVLLIAALALSADDYSLYLNGNGQYVNCGNSPDFNFTNAITVEAWIYPVDFKQEVYMNTIVAKTCWDPTSYGWSLRYGDREPTILNFNMSGGGTSWIDCTAYGVLSRYTWQHVAATYDGSNIKLYVNGTIVATQAFSGGIINADNDLCIGTINHGDMRYMTGQIDEVRIWNVARTAGEISANMEQSPTSPNLVAYYKMSNGSGPILTDDTGNGHTADLIGSPNWINDPLPEYSLQLYGYGQYVNCGSSPDFNFTNAFTVEAWIYPTNFKEAEHMNTIVAKTLWSNDFSHGWSLRYGSANRSLHLSTGRGEGVSWIGCTADYVLTLNTWQHVAATWDGVDIRLYVNGTLVATQHCPGNVANADNDLCIGTINHSDMRYMTGRIDEVRIWNVVRTASEILNNMVPCEVTDNLLAYYRMTDGSGTTLTDNSGHGHTGTLVGNATWSSNTYGVMPVVSTENPTSICMYSATLQGTIVSLGYPNPIQHGHCWSDYAGAEPNINNISGRVTYLGPAKTTGAFSSSLTGLYRYTNYYVRSYATYLVGGVLTTVYGQTIAFRTSDYAALPPTVLPASSISPTGFTANWYGDAYWSLTQTSYSNYSYYMDISTNSDFTSLVSGYSNLLCGNHSNSSSREYHSFNVTGLAAGTTYYYRLRALSYGGYSPYSSTIPVTTLAAHNVAYNTGNITGVRIFTAENDYGIDPPSPLVFSQGYSGTIQAEKDGYVWNLADGSDSNVLTDLSSNKNIAFIGTYRLVDPANPGFVYQGEPDIPISVAEIPLEDLSAPLPPLDPEDAIVLNFSGTAESDITITIPEGSWYVIAYYDDPADGGFAWHHANPYPATGPRNIVFSNLPFGTKGEIPVIISSEDATLPVELSSFTAIAMADECVNLSWVTQSESNLQGFVVLRNTVNDLNTASSISSLISASNTSQTSVYVFRDQELTSEACYYYWLEILEMNGSLSYQGPLSVLVGNPNGQEPPVIPLETSLLASYPNPFNPCTTINYQLRSPEQVMFSIYSSKGQLVATHSQAHGTAGTYSWVFKGMDQDGRALSSGVYFCVMTAGKYKSTNKMVLMK